MVPTWTLAIAAVAGAAVGVIVGWLIPRSRPTGAPASTPEPTTSTSTEVTAPEPTAIEPAAATVEEPAAAAEGSTSPAGVPRIGMEDVVTELERRYSGRRADEEREKARRKRDPDAPP